MRFEKLREPQLRNAAIRAGEWLVRNQVTDELDANCGLFLHCYSLRDGYMERSTGWLAGFSGIALLWLHQATGDDRYLEAAERAARYVLTLQVLDPDQPRFFGAFREETPQTQWLHGRDATGSAWSMLGFYKYTGKPEYLKAAVRFADWHLNYCWDSGWPKATVRMGPFGLADSTVQYQCQAGIAGFYAQMAQVTGDRKYLQEGTKRILDYYIEHFMEPSGKIHIIYAPEDNTWDTERPSPAIPGEKHEVPRSWIQMHRFNDDLGSLSLLHGYLMLGDEKYLDTVRRYARWVMSQQNPDGGFGQPESEVGSSAIPLFMLDMARVARTDSYDECIEKAFTHLIQDLQCKDEDPRACGGMFCLGNRCQGDPMNWVNARNTNYGIVALLKAIGYTGPVLNVPSIETVPVAAVV